MKSDLSVAMPPSKPLLVFDGECHFCRLWVGRGQQITGDAVDYLPSQHPDIARRFPEIPPASYDRAVQLINVDGRVYSGADAVFRAVATNPLYGWPRAACQKIPALSEFTEGIYNFIANHRPAFSRLTRWLWGLHVECPDHTVTRWFFLRALGIIYLFAFFSLGMQVLGLVGHDGILPVDRFLPTVQQQLDTQGLGGQRFHLLPTLCWFNASDTFLRLQCLAGGIFALLLILDIAPALCLALLWLLYLSLSVAGQEFLGFQWDNLLLETGFLAIFFAPRQWLPGVTGTAPPSRLMLWLLRFLLFKLMFSSGCVKLLSQDPNWRQLTALCYHYQTQPLPTWLGWYAAQLPVWFQKLSCGTMFAIELGAPFLILGPRRIRFLGAGAIALLQVLILLTGNYTFFNYLTLALCLLLLDDFVFQNLLMENIVGYLIPNPRGLKGPSDWPRFVLIPLAIVILTVSAFQIISLSSLRSTWLSPAVWLDSEIAPLRTVNRYGLFAVMTTTRNEIVVEGSNDGTHWLPYEFKYKPGDTNRAPGFVAPFQPRLDWQMWFAALGDYQQNPWFESFCERLLQGSPPVLALLRHNPFPEHPPKFVRAELYEYRFSTPSERRATGAWWHRELAGEYLPAAQLNPAPGLP
jgi:predicted DCC family thiol-disulfide oxidoreductase YuxK